MSAPLAHAVLLQALLLGLAGNALVYGLHAGIGFPLFVAIFSLGATSLVWRAERSMPREASAWLWTAVLFAALRSWRDSSTLQGLDLLATFGALGMAATVLGQPLDGLLAKRLRDTVRAAAVAARTMLSGILPVASQELFASLSDKRLSSKAGSVMRASAIIASLLLLFGSLLRSADPIFASLVTLPEIDVWPLIPHIWLFAAVAWFVGGWARAALVPTTSRRPTSDTLPFSLGALEVNSALGALNLLFALFVASQLAWFFGGERFLREQTGLTAAEYARGGFFQMVLVVLLVVPLLVGIRAALKPGRTLARRHTALSLPIIGLLGVMIVSAALRMRLYIHYFGLSTDRLYPMVFMGWLAVVLVWLALTVLRGQGRTFVAGTVISGAAMLLGLHVASVDVIVAEVNIARVADSSRAAPAQLDLIYLSRLSGETARLVVPATIAEPGAALLVPADREPSQPPRCVAARNLLKRWGPDSEAALRARDAAGWQYWNAGEAEAIRVVGANAAALYARMRDECRAAATAPAPA
jgi:Flp pilus assembly pilin Flp